MHVLRRALVEAGRIRPHRNRARPRLPAAQPACASESASLICGCGSRSCSPPCASQSWARLGITLYMASEDMEQALVEQLVTEELESLIERAHASDSRTWRCGGPNLQYHVVRWPAERGEAAGDAARARSGPSRRRRRARRDARRRYATSTARRYVVVYDAGPHELREARFRNLLLLALVTRRRRRGRAGLLARRRAHPPARRARVAGRHARTRTSRTRRSSARDHDREVAALAHALDQYHARIVEMMRREQEFTANASHELRTPLTAIRTSCELLAADAALSEKSRSARRHDRQRRACR